MTRTDEEAEQERRCMRQESAALAKTFESLEGAVARKSAREAALTVDKAGAEATIEQTNANHKATVTAKDQRRVAARMQEQEEHAALIAGLRAPRGTQIPCWLPMLRTSRKAWLARRRRCGGLRGRLRRQPNSTGRRRRR